MTDAQYEQDEANANFVPSEIVTGDVYYPDRGLRWTKLEIDASRIKEVMQNPVIKEKLNKLKYLIFREKAKIRVLDTNGNEDEELSKLLTDMADTPGVNLWAKMRMAWVEIMGYGAAFFNPVYSQNEGERRMIRLRHLPAESFAVAPTQSEEQYSAILKGVILDESTGLVRYFQSDMDKPEPRELDATSVWMVKDDSAPGVAGESMVGFIVSTVTNLNFCLKAQVQQAGRIGAPSIFIRFLRPPTAEDRKKAEEILKKWGANTAFTIPEGMEVVPLDITEGDVAQRSVEMFLDLIESFFNPSTFVQKKGDGALGSTGEAQGDMIQAWIAGVHRMIEDGFRPLLQSYLDINAYQGYKAVLDIPPPEQDQSALNLQRAKLGADLKVLTRNEIRKWLGLEALDDAAWEALYEEWKSKAETLTPPALLNTQPQGPEAATDRSGTPFDKMQGTASPSKGDAGKTAQEKVAEQNTKAQVKKEARPLEDRIVRDYDQLEDELVALLSRHHA